MTSSTTPDLELSLPALAENIAVVRHVLGGVGEALELEPELVADVKLAVSEACTNVVIHAYADSGAGLLALDVTARRSELEVVVRDHGRGMAPRPDSPGLGVGLPLIASLAAVLELTHPEEGGTEVHMRFSLPPARGEAVAQVQTSSG